MACSGMVVVSQTYFPGWEARVDGRPTHLYEAYGALQGLVVPSGTHDVEVLYRPRTAYWGAALSMVGLLASLLLAFVPRWRTGWPEWFHYGSVSPVQATNLKSE